MHITLPSRLPFSKTALIIETIVFTLLFATLAYLNRAQPYLAYFLLFLVLQTPVTSYFRYRVAQAAQPHTLTIQEHELLIKSRNIFMRGDNTTRHALNTLKGIATHYENKALHTILITHSPYNAPILLDREPRKPQKNHPITDSNNAATLRAHITHATGLPDLGFLGKQSNGKINQYITKL